MLQRIAFIPFLIIFSFDGLSNEKTSVSAHAFFISKDQNQNLVQYDARIRNDCTFDEDDPLAIYWLVFAKEAKYQREALSFIEKGIYGVDFQLRKPREIIGDIRILKSRRIDLSFRIALSREMDHCTARSSVFGRKISAEMSFSRIELRNFSGQSPRELVIVGEKSASGEPETLTLNF